MPILPDPPCGRHLGRADDRAGFLDAWRGPLIDRDFAGRPPAAASGGPAWRGPKSRAAT